MLRVVSDQILFKLYNNAELGDIKLDVKIMANGDSFVYAVLELTNENWVAIPENVNQEIWAKYFPNRIVVHYCYRSEFEHDVWLLFYLTTLSGAHNICVILGDTMISK